MAAEKEPSVLKGPPADASPSGEAETEAAGEAEADDEAGAEPEAEPEADAEADAEPETEAEADAEPEAGAEPEAEPEARPAAEPVEDAPPRATGRRPAPTFRVAGFWRRLAAGGLDLGILVPVSLLLAWIAGALAGVSLPPSRFRGIDFWLDLVLASDPALLGALGLTLAISVIYALVFQIVLARTPGMMALKIRIIDAYGEAPSTGRAVARTAGYVASAATLFLGFLWIGFDSERRGLHDWIAGTYVVRD